MKLFNYVIYACLLTSVLLLHGPKEDQQDRYQKYYTYSCVERFEIGGELSKSDCVDLNLYNRDMPGNKYYDHCCYIRLQQEGVMKHGCIGLKEIDYLDIDETIFKIEKGVYKFWNLDQIEEGSDSNGYWTDTKVYDMQCNSSFIYISVAVIISLLGLIL